MPLIETEGYTFNVPEVSVASGEFMAIVATAGGNYARYVQYDRLAETWRIRWEPGDAGVNPNPLDLYGDGLYAPEFRGWELVEDPNAGLKGDVYVCIDRGQKEWKRASSPVNAMGYRDSYLVFPENGSTRPSLGWRIYRRKKNIGPVKLLPSTSFSQPLPLP